MGRLYRSLRREPDLSYDAVVIGAGVGGLVCANLLARAGLRVLLVEQHYMVGGFCSTFKRKGFIFDAATHFYPLLGNPATVTGKLLARLGVGTTWIKMDPVDQFHFPDHSKFSVSADFEAYIIQLKQNFPQETDAIDTFFSLVRRVYLLGLLHYFREKPTKQISPYLGLTVEQVLNTHFHNTKLKLLLTADTGHWGSPPSRTSFVFDSMLRLAYFLGNYYPKGGSQVFVDDLAYQFENIGGHILMSSQVTHIDVQNNTAQGLEIYTGLGTQRRRLKVTAGAIVSNSDLRHTFEHLIHPDVMDQSYLHTLKQLRPSLPCFVTYVGLSRGIPTSLLEDIQGYHWSSWDPNEVATNAFKIFVPTLFDPEIAPAGGHTLIVQKITDIDYPSIHDWATHKASVEEFITTRLEHVIPKFSEHLVVKLSASALTSCRYTLNHHGAMLGWELSPGQLGDGRPHVVGPFKNLYLVGHWTRPGGGITPVMVSAMHAADAVLGSRNWSTGRAPLSETEMLSSAPLLT